MEKRFFRLGLSLLFASIIFSCNQTGSENKENTDSTQAQLEESEMQLQSNISGIYQYHNNGDTVELQIQVDSTQVNGNLIFALKEKDRNIGTIEGQITNGLLLAEYNFMSEGLMSVRQVAFKIENNTATAMNGEMEERDGKQVYKNPNSLQPDKMLILQKQ